jgi:3-hydroxyacyl-CoA dehydrogenase
MSTRSISKLVVLGSGTMAAGAAAVFASTGAATTILARSVEKAEAGRAKAEAMGKGRVPAGAIRCGSYASDLGHELADADLVLECVAEDLGTKRELFTLVDRLRAATTIVATVSSGLSIRALCAERSADFQRQFLGIHLFNPPTLIIGCELIPHAGTDPGVVAVVRDFLVQRCGRAVVETRDTPAFAGNRLGFRVLNEVAQLAEEHGVAYMDQLVGPHTGRALAPLATIDLVGWDVHAAIVDNLYATTCDVAHATFRLPDYMRAGIARGVLGRKAKNGFVKVEGKGPDATKFVLDPATGAYRPWAEVAPPVPAFIEKMRSALEGGRPSGAMSVLCDAEGPDADLLRRIVLGYISYGLGLVGHVVEHARDIDRIMSFGFSWAPPGMLVDAIGPSRTIRMLEAAKLPVPLVVIAASGSHRALFDEPEVRPSKFFAA